jgi:hypothetical protein
VTLRGCRPTIAHLQGLLIARSLARSLYPTTTTFELVTCSWCVFSSEWIRWSSKPIFLSLSCLCLVFVFVLSSSLSCFSKRELYKVFAWFWRDCVCQKVWICIEREWPILNPEKGSVLSLSCLCLCLVFLANCKKCLLYVAVKHTQTTSSAMFSETVHTFSQ